MILYMYIEPGQGQTAPRGQNFDVNRKALSLYTFVASFKFELVFIKDYAPNICLSPNMAEFAVSYFHKKFWTLLKRLTGNLHIIPYQLTMFQAPSSNNFRDILLTSLKWLKFSKGHNSGKIKHFFLILLGNLLIIPYQLAKFQAPSSNTLRYLADKISLIFFKGA